MSMSDISGIHHNKYLNKNYSKTIICSVRGTSSKNDILSDLYVTKRKFRDIISKNKNKYKNLKVHSGFLKQYNSLKFMLIQTIFKHMQSVQNTIIINNELNINLPLRLIFTSHSLGAAVSVLLSTLLKHIFSDKIYIVNYLFGCPKVGNSDFSNLYNDTIDETYRYVNKNDIITRIPKINYKTTKNRIILGQEIMNKSKSNSKCYCFHKIIGSIDDHFMKSYIEELSKL
jgi:predicted lipase